MKQWCFSEEQINGILKQAEAGRAIGELCRDNGISEGTYYRWKASMVVYKSAKPNGSKNLKRRMLNSSDWWPISPWTMWP